MTIVGVLKVLLPHLALIALVTAYLLFGTIAFRAIESENDVKLLEQKTTKIVTKYQDIATAVEQLCFPAKQNVVEKEWKRNLFNSLSLLSEIHENRPYKVDVDEPNNTASLVKSRWKFIDGLLYSLSVLTTTGYNNASPITKTGKIFAIAYGLFGIPLMVLMVVDVGRFLADSTVIIYSRIVIRLHSSKFIYRYFPSMFLPKTGNNNGRDDKMKKLSQERLPIWMVVGIFLMFNIVGGLLYMIQSETRVTFLEALFVCFNLMTNLTMSEITVVNSVTTILYIVAIVTFGLAILSMCADLAAEELKRLFVRLHYFGRRIERRMRTYDDLVALAEDEHVKSLLAIIREIRRDEPRIGEITPKDILGYIQNKTSVVQEQRQRKRGRGAPSPFMPIGIEVLKFVDAEEIDMQNLNQTSSSTNLAAAEDEESLSKF